MTRKVFIAFLISAAAFLSFVLYAFLNQSSNRIVNPFIKKVEEKVYPLRKYSFDNLSKSEFAGGEIEIGEKIDEVEGFKQYVFYFYAEDPINKSEKKRVSGLLSIPKKTGEYPILIQLRGYVDREIYSTGIGTKRSAEVFAESGFISLSPDFLGYGESDNPSNNSIEERFQTYSTALSLIASLKNLNEAFKDSDIRISAVPNKLVLWGHSNGGHIALSVLAIIGKEIPTVLWAPVTKPFPYSILYFTDEFEDEGRALRKVVADFEKDYDVFEHSPSNFYSRIKSPIQIHQGTADDAVPLEWTNEFVEKLDDLEIENEYFVYPGADHSLLGGWNTAVRRSINFYREKLAD